MKKEFKSLTTAQFAKLHEVNKRTLHYYDEIGLFRPRTKADNGYRYYNVSQSIDFEYIRMLKELNMSIEEIERYRENPSADNFLKIVDTKEKELDQEIQKLKNIKKVLRAKKEQIVFCETLKEQEIRIEECKAERILSFPYHFAEDDLSQIFVSLKDRWGIEQIRMGIGSFLSLDKVYRADFAEYDGIYTIALNQKDASSSFVKPEGTYLCGYQKGTWDKLPALYENMLKYAEEQGFKLAGYAYEVGLNDFVISSPEDYITKIMIRIEGEVTIEEVMGCFQRSYEN